MRVIAGALKGQRLTMPKGRTTRPTADQVRIACLDTLMPYLEAGPFLDLFAGAGGIGIAFSVVFGAHRYFECRHDQVLLNFG